MVSLLIRLLGVSLLAVAFAAACGGDDDTPSRSPGLQTETPNAIPSVGGPQQQPAPPQALSSEPVEPTNGVIEVSILNIQFEKNYLHLSVGDAVTIRVTNNDNVPHDLRIAGIDGQFNTDDDAVTTPDQINGGQVGELTFAPPAAGVYTFHCDFHPNQMGGEIVVGDATPIPAQAAQPVESPTDTPTQ